MAKKCARTFSIVVEKGKKSILEVRHLLPDALPRSVSLAAQRAWNTRGNASNAAICRTQCPSQCTCNGA